MTPIRGPPVLEALSGKRLNPDPHPRGRVTQRAQAKREGVWRRTGHNTTERSSGATPLVRVDEEGSHRRQVRVRERATPRVSLRWKHEGGER